MTPAEGKFPLFPLRLQEIFGKMTWLENTFKAEFETFDEKLPQLVTTHIDPVLGGKRLAFAVERDMVTLLQERIASLETSTQQSFNETQQSLNELYSILPGTVNFSEEASRNCKRKWWNSRTRASSRASTAPRAGRS